MASQVFDDVTQSKISSKNKLGFTANDYLHTARTAR
jgi:hypothetical protein